MARFHNRVVDTLPASVPAAQRFAIARELVVKHYQWMLRTTTCRGSAAESGHRRLHDGRKVFEGGATPTDVPTMPIEFSVAAFRLGHSMVRATYNWNKVFDDGVGCLICCSPSRHRRHLGGDPHLPSNWIADFRRLYDFGGRPARPTWRCRRRVQPREGGSTRR